MDNDEGKPRKRKHRERGIFEKVPGSGVWWIRYTDESGQLHREKAGPKGLAKDAYRKRKTQIREGKFFPEQIRRKETTLAAAIDDYLDRKESQLRHFYHYRRHGRYWKEALGSRTLRSIQPADIEAYVTERAKKVAPATVNRELAFLKTLYSDAVSNGKAETNPVKRVKLFKENNARVRWLTEKEEGKLFEQLPGRYDLLVRFAYNTGLRQSEQFGLLWENVDFDNGVVTVTQSKHGEARKVPLNQDSQRVLELLRAFGESKKARIFPINAHNFYNRIFKPALERAEIDNFHWHDLRHTFGSRLAMKGVPILTIRELMGHKTLTMTLRYAHLAPDHLQDAVERLTDTTTDTKPQKRFVVLRGKGRKPKETVRKVWWAGSESNTRHKDFQSFALPTELPAHRAWTRAR
jgi:integrase